MQNLLLRNIRSHGKRVKGTEFRRSEPMKVLSKVSTFINRVVWFYSNENIIIQTSSKIATDLHIISIQRIKIIDASSGSILILRYQPSHSFSMTKLCKLCFCIISYLWISSHLNRLLC